MSDEKEETVPAEEEEEEEEDLEKLQEEIARMEAEAARISKQTEAMEKKKDEPATAGAGANSDKPARDGYVLLSDYYKRQCVCEGPLLYRHSNLTLLSAKLVPQ